MFRKNPKLPNVHENKPPDLQNNTTKELVAVNLNAIHAARKAFVEPEASEKLIRAILRKKKLPTSLKFSTWHQGIFQEARFE